MKITATFLDEITCDIPSNNWGAREWAREFRLLRACGVETVVMIRSGFKKTSAWPSAVLQREVAAYPVYLDLADLFLDLAEQNGIKFFFPTYDSNEFWARGDLDREVAINLALIDEIWERYGQRKAFAGWYLTNEFARRHSNLVECVRRLGLHAKSVSGGLTTMISPFIEGSKQFASQIGAAEHEREWDEILTELQGAVDIVAFQDGHVDYHELPAYLEINRRLIEQHGMAAWSNVESFDRDMPINFPPADWRKLRFKMDAAAAAGMTKLITFEFSHFMSPFSCWPAARNLFLRYCEFTGMDGPALIAQAEGD